MQAICITKFSGGHILKIKINDLILIFALTQYTKILFQHIINIKHFNEKVYIFCTKFPKTVV